MQLVDYIDYRSIFEKVKTNHLKEFPTKESYIEYLKQEEEDYSFVSELYFALGLDFSEFDTDSSDTIDDLSLSINTNKAIVKIMNFHNYIPN